MARGKITNGTELRLGLGPSLLLPTGCAVFLVGGGVAAGIGGYAYVKGELKATENAPLDRVWDASLEAMKDLRYPVTGRKKNALNGESTARKAQDKKIEVQLTALSDNSTEITIRVGKFGDEALSLVILEKIKKRL